MSIFLLQKHMPKLTFKTYWIKDQNIWQNPPNNVLVFHPPPIAEKLTLFFKKKQMNLQEEKLTKF